MGGHWAATPVGGAPGATSSKYAAEWCGSILDGGGQGENGEGGETGQEKGRKESGSGGGAEADARSYPTSLT